MSLRKGPSYSFAFTDLSSRAGCVVICEISEGRAGAWGEREARCSPKVNRLEHHGGKIVRDLASYFVTAQTTGQNRT